MVCLMSCLVLVPNLSTRRQCSSGNWKTRFSIWAVGERAVTRDQLVNVSISNINIKDSDASDAKAVENDSSIGIQYPTSAQRLCCTSQKTRSSSRVPKCRMGVVWMPIAKPPSNDHLHTTFSGPFETPTFTEEYLSRITEKVSCCTSIFLQIMAMSAGKHGH